MLQVRLIGPFTFKEETITLSGECASQMAHHFDRREVVQVATARKGGLEQRVRVPELAVGVLIVTGCVLGALLWQRSIERGTAVLVAGRDLQRGQVVSESDLSAVMISSDRTLVLLRATTAEQVVGMRVLVDIPAGTPLNPTQVSEIEPVDSRHALMGVTVTAREAPLDLAAGDTVQMVVMTTEVDGNRRADVLEKTAVVWAITSPDEIDGGRSVTLRLPIDAMAVSVGHDVLHLIKVNG